MNAPAVTLLALTIALAGCAAGADKPVASPTPTEAGTKYRLDDNVPDGSVRFVVLGDVGTGLSGEQDEVADGVVKVCRVQGCDFALVAGDNIYNSGVRNEYDPQFNSKFEEPYAGVDMPFYLVLGNHDNGGSSGENSVVGDYQVLYTQRTDRPSDKWNMPARYYQVTHEAVTFVGIDSGPTEIAISPIWAPGSRGANMEDWLAQQTPKISTPWKFAFAHHGYWSNSIHQDAGAYDGQPGRGLWYKQLLERQICGKYNVFFAGHDHNLQWLKPSPNCAGTELIISGGGGASLYAKRAAGAHEAYFEDYAHHGFLWVDVTGNTFTGVFYDQDGNKLFERTMTANAVPPLDLKS